MLMKNKMLTILMSSLPFLLLPGIANAGFLAGLSGIALTLVNMLISFAISAIMNKIFGRKNRDQEREAQALLINKQSNNDPTPVIYGKLRTGGVRAYIESSNGSGDVSATTYMNVVLSMCEGQMGAIKQLMFNDIVVWNADASGTTTDLGGGAYSLDYSSFESTDYKNSTSIDVIYHDGRDDQTVDSMMSTSVGAKWGTNHRLRAVAYMAVKLQFDSEKYSGGLPLITAVLAGKYVADVSTITAGDTSYGTQTVGADQNPIDVLYDYMTNKRYGKGLDHKPDGTYSANLDIDIDSIKQARIDCAAAGFEINGVLHTNNKLYENMQQISDSCNALVIYTAGKYKVMIQKPSETSVMNFNTDNMLGEMTVTGAVKANRLNKITTEYPNEATNYNEDMLITDNTAYLSTDNGNVLETTVKSNLLTDETVVTKLNDWTLDTSRYQQTISFLAPHTALICECGDIITVTHDVAGWTAKPFRIMQMDITETNDISIIATEYISSIQV